MIYTDSLNFPILKNTFWKLCPSSLPHVRSSRTHTLARTHTCARTHTRIHTHKFYHIILMVMIVRKTAAHVFILNKKTLHSMNRENASHEYLKQQLMKVLDILGRRK